MLKISVLPKIFLLLISIVFLKLVYLQYFSKYHESKYQHFKTEILTPKRGEIYDSKNNPLAINNKKYDVYVEPKLLDDKDNLKNIISNEFKIEISTVEAKLNSNKIWQRVGVKANEEQMQKLKKFVGVHFENAWERSYPESSLASHIIGFVGENSDGLPQGYFGLEGIYNDDLKGLPGIIKTEQDTKGLPMVAGLRQVITGQDGRNLHLTLDKNIQYLTKKRLIEGMEKWGAKSGCIIVANPVTMAILASSCVPDFDPNYYYKFNDEYFINPAISHLFEPGSIFKPLVMAAAIESKIIEPQTKFLEVGPIQIGAYNVSTWDQKYEGEITMTRVLEKSSNVGMVEIGKLMGKELFYDYLQRFGIYEKTNIDLQGEAKNNKKDIKDFYPIDLATATFGQGIAMTPIQIVTMFASVINGGFLMQPHLVDYFADNLGNNNYIKPKKVRQLFSAETSKKMREILFSTVNNGESKYKIPKNYQIGGKTGTAQLAVGTSYDETKSIASFIGFLPKDDPKIVVLVSYKEPSSSIYGSETAAPTFFDLASDLILYLNIPKSK